MSNGPTPLKAPTAADGSIAHQVEDIWVTIVRNWVRGRPSDTTVSRVAQLLALRRADIADGRLAEGFDWSTDLIQGELLHEANIDWVTNRRAYNETLEKNWQDWIGRVSDYLANISLEGLRSMIIIHGAAILAALTVVSGQITAVKPAVTVAAKLMLFTSILGISCAAFGFLLVYLVLSEQVDFVRSRLIRPMKHIRYRSLYRYLRRHYAMRLRVGNWFAYASIGLFIGGSMLASFFLLAS